MGETGIMVMGWGILLLIGAWLWFLRREHRKRNVALANDRVLQAEAVMREAQEDLRVARKYANKETLTDDELTRLAYFAVSEGLASPEQKQLVLKAEELRAAQAQLSVSQETLARAQSLKQV